MPDRLDYSEKIYFDSIKNDCEIIFDVGASDYSIFFKETELEVHYFEPFEKPFGRLLEADIKNKKKYLINKGLSDEKNNLPYYIEGSLYDRNMSKKIIGNCEVITGIEYCELQKVDKIDFLKIDVEGMETKVLRGFDNFLSNIKFIQFEYGIGLRDAGSNLKEVFDLLRPHGFSVFYKQTDDGLVKIENDGDFWEWCNICTSNEKYSQ